MDENRHVEIEYDKWAHVITLVQLITASCVFVIEVANNLMLYVTRSQGYGPDTIVEKLIRYLLLTTLINFGLVLLSRFVERRVENERLRKYILMACLILICTDVAFSHYQFATTLVIFVVPIIISIVYEDRRFSCVTLALSLAGQTLAIVTRAMDPVYGKDMAPEAVIAYGFTFSVFTFSILISNTLVQRRNDLRDAVIKADRADAAAEKLMFSMKMLETLAGTIDAKDKYTNGHSRRVALYATKLADALGWDAEEIETLKYEALLHDIGKIGVPDMILNKPARLSETEFSLIKSHTLIGADILKNMIAVPGAGEVAKYHHERFDGSGYPSGLAGEEIPLHARVLCIADAYDAMNSDRIYRKALPEGRIRKELVGGRGTQFDPELLDVFLAMFDAGELHISVQNVLGEPDTAPETQGLMDDIEKVLRRVTRMDETRSSFYDFDKFYKYMRNIGLRYHRSIEVLSIDLEPANPEGTFEREEEAADYLQLAIQKNIRSVDVYYRYSTNRHMIILLDAGADNIDLIRERILFDYSNYEKGRDFVPQFRLNESIENEET